MIKNNPEIDSNIQLDFNKACKKALTIKELIGVLEQYPNKDLQVFATYGSDDMPVVTTFIPSYGKEKLVIYSIAP